MDRSIQFKLIALNETQDDIGQFIEDPSVRVVYGQIASVSASEFFSAGQNGFKPEYRITMFGPDYEGEHDCEIDGERYSIYRVYRTRYDKVELYLERRVGDGEG